MTALDAEELDHCTAVWATVAYAVANLDELLPRQGAYIPPPVLGASVAAYSVVLTLLAALLSFIGTVS